MKNLLIKIKMVTVDSGKLKFLVFPITCFRKIKSTFSCLGTPSHLSHLFQPASNRLIQIPMGHSVFKITCKFLLLIHSQIVFALKNPFFFLQRASIPPQSSFSASITAVNSEQSTWPSPERSAARNQRPRSEWGRDTLKKRNFKNVNI